MRKAALIVGIIFAMLIATGALLKLNDIPGGGLLTVLGTGCYCLFALPLQLIYNIRRNKNGLRRSADVIGLFGLWFLLLGLLYKAQSWPGAHVVLMGGIGFTLVFAVLFFMASRKGESTDWFPGFTITVLVVIVSLSAAWMETDVERVDIDTQRVVYETELSKCKDLVRQTDELIAQLDADGSWDRDDTTALTFHYEAMEVIRQIEQVKAGLVYESNMMTGGDVNSGKIYRPEDIDVTTMFMVGSDPGVPTGHGMDVYEQLRHYREILPAGVPFAVPTSADNEAQEQWVKDNFYHATVLQALTILTKTEAEIYNSLITALERKAYIE